MSLKNLKKKAQIANGTRAESPQKKLKRTATKITNVKTSELPEDLQQRYKGDIHAIATYAMMIRGRVQQSLFDKNFEAHGANKRIENIIQSSDWLFNYLTNYATPTDLEEFSYEHVPEMLEAVEKIIYSPIGIIQRFNEYLTKENEDIVSAAKQTLSDHRAQEMLPIPLNNYMIDINKAKPAINDIILARFENGNMNVCNYQKDLPVTHWAPIDDRINT